MSREIKFRAWDKKEKLMGAVERLNFEYGEVSLNFFHDYYKDHISFDKVELMQYTGLKDCKGVEIYEGDILKYGSCVEVVFYEPTMGRFMTELKKCNDESEIGEISSLSPYYTDNYKVIGNIYQHLELLKDEKSTN